MCLRPAADDKVHQRRTAVAPTSELNVRSEALFKERAAAELRKTLALTRSARGLELSDDDCALSDDDLDTLLPWQWKETLPV